LTKVLLYGERMPEGEMWICPFNRVRPSAYLPLIPHVCDDRPSIIAFACDCDTTMTFPTSQGSRVQNDGNNAA
jgi:hypothetical protein